MSRFRYDLILANHNTCVNYLSKKGKIIQTCHGIFPELEQPSQYADGFVSISEEVKTHLIGKGFSSQIILNGINCERFKVSKPINLELKKVLSLSQSEPANLKIKTACNALGLEFSKFNKHKNPVWNVEDYINTADLVIGLGRSAYEAMACGRLVLVYDERDYNSSRADGYMTVDLVKKCIKNNCSGRYFNYKFGVNDLVESLKKYNSNDGEKLRAFAVEYLNIEKQVVLYLDLAKNLSKKHNYFKLLKISLEQKKRLKEELPETILKRKRRKENKRKRRAILRKLKRFLFIKN